MYHGLPEPQSLYHPDHEHEACGLGFVADTKGSASHDVVRNALDVLSRMSHRGASGADPGSGDGCGLLLQIPHTLYRRALACDGIVLPPPGDYGVAMIFLSQDPEIRSHHERDIEAAAKHFGQEVIAWRTVPCDHEILGVTARDTMPVIRQLFIGRRCPHHAFERVLFMVRKRVGKITTAHKNDLYIVSCSCKSIVYKGLMLPERLAQFYPDLANPECKSRLAMVHSRFSTNTFPTWDRAHPYRRIAHNGEINTLRGNTNWMLAREGALAKPVFGDYIHDLKSIIRPGGSDSAALDNVVDFLLAGGRSLPHVMMMLIPEARGAELEMPSELRAFYDFHADLVEPWDGPAAILFTDGVSVGAILDRNGLRPAKYTIMDTGLVVAASEFGVLDLDPRHIVECGRLKPGQMLMVDTDQGKILRDHEIKMEVASQQPYAQWVADNKIDLAQLPEVSRVPRRSPRDRKRLQKVFGYSREDLEVLIKPMAEDGAEPVGSMGTDIPLAVLSHRPVSLFRYFKQQFAQVTNPAIDPIREQLVMSLASSLGGEGNLLDETPSQARLVELPHPILCDGDLDKIRRNPFPEFESLTLEALFVPGEAPALSLEMALAELCAKAEQAVDVGYSIVILSDLGVTSDFIPIPSVLAVSAVHHHLICAGKRTRVGLVVESGEPREVADFALLIGYGAGAVNPYLAFDSIRELCEQGVLELSVSDGIKNYVYAIKKGLLKVLAKMGISTLASYHGAQIFECIGISKKVINRYFTGTLSVLDGIGLSQIAHDAIVRHRSGYEDSALDVGGVYAWRIQGERHLWTPTSVAALQKAVRLKSQADYKAYAKAINDQGENPMTLRGLWDFHARRDPVSLEEVESAQSIVKRFCTGAMSFGSISAEAHENLAIAMNRMGGKSNSGEGGEDASRFVADDNGDLRRSAVKQVASARFGVTAHYLVNADEIQIKISQGAKPGEGGQLPGHKVDAIIAKVRHATPGVTLISPPPHHDIYSIEDLAQLIFDLKNCNPQARIGVKLVSESGIGTVAAGVAKTHADCIYIAGHDGGTGASPLSSIQHAGTPWELGLAEAQQVLLMNDLRSRVVLQADGQLKTGRDVAFAALLGAEEFGFATAPLVASGCVMMRKCHLNTCPVGVATQDPILRKRFVGTPEHVINFFFFVAEELREIMASLGFRTVLEMVGQVDCIRVRGDIQHPKASHLDFSSVLSFPRNCENRIRHHALKQDHGLHDVLDHAIMRLAHDSLENGNATYIDLSIGNKDRACGAMLSGEVAKRYGEEGLPEGTITAHFVGIAGQSFGAFLAPGITFYLEGLANDYVGKGLSGGILAIRPPKSANYIAARNVLVGNTVLYGATSGTAFFCGQAGERFAVRNSGATAVVEGCGDHGCEYMTGGRVLVLGATGRNFGAGMSGGLAYVYDERSDFHRRCNNDMIDLEDLDDDDSTWIRSMLAQHAQRTGSVRAHQLLEEFVEHRRFFVKVFPREYRRVLNNEELELSHG